MNPDPKRDESLKDIFNRHSNKALAERLGENPSEVHKTQENEIQRNAEQLRKQGLRIQLAQTLTNNSPSSNRTNPN
jgi:hypothetical protein